MAKEKSNVKRTPILKTPDQIANNRAIANSCNRVSRQAKGLSDKFEDYDREILAPIDYFDIDVKIEFKIKRKILLKDAKKAIAFIKNKEFVDGNFTFICKKDYVTSVIYKTDKYLEYSNKFITDLEKKINKNFLIMIN
jgi:hypothetical protein